MYIYRGANAVGYTSYPDNVVYEFCKEAHKHGMDIFRIFDSLNYIDNLKLGIDAVGSAGGVVETAIAYTGDVSNPEKGKYNLDYYLDLARQLEKLGTHILCIKDMAGLLRPEAAKLLIGTLRREFPHLPLHVHTHDTAGTGVASMLAAAMAGADAVDVAIEAMSGLTSQPAMGGVVASLSRTPLEPEINMAQLQEINDYWQQVRELYAPFESGQKSAGSDVYFHEMPGGQYTNLLFQSNSLGLTGRWPAVKKAYAQANQILGDIIKVTPSSKVVGDLAQFMVQNDLSPENVIEQAASLSFPSSVYEFLQGYLGQPVGGFPEPFRSRALKGAPTINGRPGASLPPLDFDTLRTRLTEKYSKDKLHDPITDADLLSYAMYPKVFEEYRDFKLKHADVSVLPTRYFLSPMSPGEEISFELQKGITLVVQLLAVSEDVNEAGERKVFFEVNGLPRTIRVKDKKLSATVVSREKAAHDTSGSIGAPMPGQVIGVKAVQGTEVKAGSPLVVLSAMKMETVVSAPIDGKIKRLVVGVGDDLKLGDLLVEIEPKQ